MKILFVKIKNVFIALVLFFSFISNLQAQDIPDGVLLSLENGNAKELANFFNNNVELVVLENDNVYSKAQAQQIVSNFFSEFKPVESNSFELLHDGGKEGGAKFIIGRLKTEKAVFRVSILLKQDNNKSYIHQLTIERES